ncbi:unnamed protein product [Sphagnum tenellum]
METLCYPEGLDVKNERARFLMGYAVHGDAILANIGSTWHSEGKCVYGDVTLNNYHRSPLHLFVDHSGKEETSIDCTDEDKSDQVKEFHVPGAQDIEGPFPYTVMVQQPEGDEGKSDKIEFESEGFFRTTYDAIQSAAQKAVHHYNTWCESGPHPPPHNMSRHDLSNFSELSSLTACGKCNCNEDMAGDATLFASTNGLEKTELENLLEGQHEFEFELGAGTVIAPFEEWVRRAHVGQTLCFQVPAQPVDLLLASNKNIMSGDLFNSLLKELRSLRQIMGVDISQKTLIRAAKALQRTLTTQKPGHSCPLASLQKLSLYEGSITDMDPELHAPDVATCIEVMGHLDREEVEKVGRECWAVLFHEIWIVRTPNMEYNPILRGLQWDPATSSSCRVGVGGEKEYEDIINDDTAGPGFAIRVAIFAHNSVLFPIVRKEVELPALLACDLNRVTSEFTFHSGVLHSF